MRCVLEGGGAACGDGAASVVASCMETKVHCAIFAAVYKLPVFTAPWFHRHI